MEYTTPILGLVGSAQALVLGWDQPGPDSAVGGHGNDTSPSLAVIGLDE
jgi:hypothetical protein